MRSPQEQLMDMVNRLEHFEAPETKQRAYEAVFRKADELGWEGEEQFMGELIEIVDAALSVYLATDDVNTEAANQ